MRFTLFLLSFVVFMCACVAVLAMWPAKVISLLYLWTIPVGLSPFVWSGLQPHASYVKGISRNWSVVVVLSLLFAGIPPFVTYWVSGSHHLAIQISLVFMCLWILFFIVAGGRLR